MSRIYCVSTPSFVLRTLDGKRQDVSPGTFLVRIDPVEGYDHLETYPDREGDDLNYTGWCYDPQGNRAAFYGEWERVADIEAVRAAVQADYDKADQLSNHYQAQPQGAEYDRQCGLYQQRLDQVDWAIKAAQELEADENRDLGPGV